MKDYMQAFSLTYFEDHLLSDPFVRIHRFYEVPLTRLNARTRKLVIFSTIALPVSNMYRGRFL